MSWLDGAAGLAWLDAAARARLGQLVPTDVAGGTILFRPGDSARGFVIVLDGRIDVYLTGTTGREILLYTVEPGGSCVQTTLGLLGGEDYSAEAITATDTRVVLVPRDAFLGLMDQSAAFRTHVFAAFAARMQGMMHVLERVAFIRVEARLAEALLTLAEDGWVRATHQELAARIGTAREVVSRRLEAFARDGWVETERGAVILRDAPALGRLAATAR
ncbi:Crp/Fnr family transcriptional regulator [Albidovulum sediminicola]|uniref:Crp/Fnr family transcriptional regulator n=1 Tax=Albidovulum sediminicola TaxID=2984331 RepID=A0ABT2YZG0_9RHOB|nr:Crp/Fnr family transcriptional regulator [Defluviimonas sp. WL0075]MCV2864243.1 Crp/Fnr family transcriptional regulator [Defluviimonas sp. WL0075]